MAVNTAYALQKIIRHQDSELTDVMVLIFTLMLVPNSSDFPTREYRQLSEV
jgi:hypothetical protein